MKKGTYLLQCRRSIGLDAGKQSYYVLDEAEKEQTLARLEKGKSKISVQRFKGLGEMNPGQLRETTMNVDTRRLVQLTIDDGAIVEQLLDKLLMKQHASERKKWLEEKGNLAII